MKPHGPPQLFISVLDETVKHLVVDVFRTTPDLLNVCRPEYGRSRASTEKGSREVIISMQKGTAVIAAKNPHLAWG